MNYYLSKESGDKYQAIQLDFTISGFQLLKEFLGPNGIHTHAFRQGDIWSIDIGWKDDNWPDGMYYMRPCETCWVVSHIDANPNNPYFCLANDEFHQQFELI